MQTTATRAGAEWPLDEPPGGGGEEKGGSEEDCFGLRLGQAEGLDDCDLAEDQQRPVPEIERVRDEADEDDRAQREEAASEAGCGLAGEDDGAGRGAGEQCGLTGEERVLFEEKDGEED